MKNAFFLFGFIAIFLINVNSSFSQAPTNDECSGAISLAVNTDNNCTNSYSGSIGYATQSFAPCPSAGSQAFDIWYKFVATSSTHRITVTPLYGNDYAFEVYKGSCANLVSLNCVNNGSYNVQDLAVLNNLIPGNTYYMRVYSTYGWASEDAKFDICINSATATLDNDDCSGAINIIPSSTTSCNNSKRYTNVGATKSMDGCYGTAEDDTWFKFTATSSRHRILVNTEGTTNTVLEVFSGSCTNLKSMGCYYESGLTDGILKDLTNLTPGTTYYYRIYGRDTNTLRTQIYTCVSTLNNPPINDECDGAISLAVNSDNSCTNSYSGSIGFATQSLGPCPSTSAVAYDIWFKFVATASAHKVTVTPLYGHDYTFEVYGGSCANLTSLGCVNNGDYNVQDITALNNLTPGNTYYIRIYSNYGWASEDAQFNICINSATSILDNDDCSGAITIIPSPTVSCSRNTRYTNIGATQSIEGCFGTAEDDIWFKFTATSSRHRIIVNTERIHNTVLEVFTGSCPNLKSIGCFYESSPNYGILKDLSNLIPGTTYYYRIYGSDANTSRTQIYTCVSTLSNAPENDECSGAITLTVNADNNCTNTYSGSIGYATQSLTPCPSAGTQAFDVWFKFVATKSTHRITVTPLNGNGYALEVFGGSCTNLVSLACVNNGGYYVQDIAALNNLTPGNTYYIRVYSTYGWASEDATFSICINTATATLDNDNCSGAIDITPAVTPTCNNRTTRYTNIGATQSMEGCFGTAEDDIWFKFTATSSRHRILVNTEDTTNTVLEIFSGSCGNLTSMGCYYESTPNDGILKDLTNLIPGTTYYYRVYGRSASTIRTQVYTCVSTISSTLPIILTAFQVKKEEKLNNLLWTTTNEINFVGFEIQRSKDGINFEKLSFVSSISNSTVSRNNYKYSDDVSYLNQDKFYYKLKEIDKDGKSSFSNVILVERRVNNQVIIFPNPVTEKLYLKNNIGNASYVIKDMFGREISSGQIKNNEISINRCRTGLYMLLIYTPNGRQVLKFEKN